MNEHTSRALNIVSSAERLSLLPPKGSGQPFGPRAAWQAGHLHVLRAAESRRVLCLGAPRQGTQEDRYIQGDQKGRDCEEDQNNGEDTGRWRVQETGRRKGAGKRGASSEPRPSASGWGHRNHGTLELGTPGPSTRSRVGGGAGGPGPRRSRARGAPICQWRLRQQRCFLSLPGGQESQTRGCVPSRRSGEGPPSPHQPLATWFPAAGPSLPVQLHPASLTPRGPSCGPGAPKPVCLL